jgi:RNA polymerase sigma-70 factor (ECF subfamily)
LPASATEPAHAGADGAALLGRVAAGERSAAVAGLYDLYAPRVYAIGLRLLGGQGVAEELVQETFVRLWQSAGRFDSGLGSADAFVMTIARRTAVDLHRRATSRPPSAGWEPGEEPADDAAFDRVILELDIRRALDALPDKQRVVLELSYRQDLTQRQIADRLAIPIGTVKTRTWHALHALKRELEASNVGA